MKNPFTRKDAGRNCIFASGKTRLRFITIIILALGLFAGKGWCQLIPFAENFSYPAGNLAGQGGWTLQGTDNTNPIQVTSPGLFFPQYQSSGIGFAATLARNATGQDLFSNFTGTNTISAGSVYISALVKVTSGTRAGDYFISFKETTNAGLTVFKGRLYAKDSLGTGNLVFGVTKSASSSSVPVSWTPTYYSFGTTYLVVLKYTFVTGTANDPADIYVFDPANPFPVSEPSTPNATASDAGSDGTGQRCVQLRQGALNSPVAIVDGIRVGQSWSEAVTQDNTPPAATFDPANGAMNILISTVPTVTFNEPVRKTDGNPILASDLSTLVTLKKTNGSGASVPFTASINGSNTVITITPTGQLDYSQLYYLAVGPVQDGAGNNSDIQSSAFTTIANTISHDATLDDLKVDGTTVTGFSPAILDYFLIIPYGLPTVPAVTATPNFPLATAVVTPAASLPGTTSVLVTAQDGTTLLTYTVTFTYGLPSSNSALSYIKWLPNGFDPLKQNIRVKDFVKTTFDYSIEIPSETNSLIVDTEPDFVIPASGCPPATYIVTQPTNLAGTAAERTATVVCTAQDGSTSTYHVTFAKESPSMVFQFKEGFDIMPPAGWTNTANVGTSATSGMGFYGSIVTYATPKFKWASPTDGGTLTTTVCNGANVLKFFVKVLDKNASSNLHLFVEKSYDNSTWSLVSQDPMPLYVSITQWHQVILPVNDYSPAVYLRFRASATTGDNSTGLFLIDDVSVTANAAPVAYNVTGSGSYCQGGTGLTVSLSGSQVNVNYQLIKNNMNSGAPLPGTGSALTWTGQTAGTYTVSANNPIGTSHMNGSAVITTDPLNAVSISIAESANNVAPGTLVTFTATPVNGGSSPGYQWQVNSGNVPGATTSTYSYTPVNNDQVNCILTSNISCSSGNPATSNTITMTVVAVPATLSVSGTVGTGQSACYNAVQTITVAGSPNTFIVQNGGNASMIAGQNILFYPGVKVYAGGYLHGKISPGGPFCGTKSASILSADDGNENIPAGLESSFFKVYPNPTSGAFTLEFTREKPAGTVHVEIYGVQGEKVLATSLSGHKKYAFSLEGRPSGFYFMRVICDEKSGTDKIIKQ